MPTSLFVLSVERGNLVFKDTLAQFSPRGKDVSYMNLENPHAQDLRASFFISLGCSGSFDYLEHESLPPTTLLPGQSCTVRKCYLYLPQFSLKAEDEFGDYVITKSYKKFVAEQETAEILQVSASYL